jgi:hypothetical protein
MTGAAMASARHNNGMQPTPQSGAADAGRSPDRRRSCERVGA